ncbi:MAG: DUF4262 domain-containing protein [Dissulfurispiraceae bacterium]|jgi:hypothetical protein
MCNAQGKCGSCGGNASFPGSGKLLNYNIRTNGFGILYSFAELPSFAYSAGIEENWCHPELIVFGLGYSSSTRLITETANLIRGGTSFTDQNGHYRIGDINVRFLEVPNNSAKQYLRETTSYYREKKFRVLQLLWSDEQGFFPFDHQCSDEVKRIQPILSEGNHTD